MKQRKYLNKYKHSTYRGERILCIDVWFNDQFSYIEIKTKNYSKRINVFINIGYSTTLFDYSADYLLCSVQEKPDINVMK